MISGISHITFIVRDLDRTAKFFETVFDAGEVYSGEDRVFSLSREKFFLIGGVWICIMQGEPPSPRTYNHVAFYVPDDELNGYIEKIKLSGAEIRTGRPRVSGEGRSVYFYDFDNNLFELHTGTLRERLDRYAALQDS